jgi:hypothetical protein
VAYIGYLPIQGDFENMLSGIYKSATPGTTFSAVPGTDMSSLIDQVYGATERKRKQGTRQVLSMRARIQRNIEMKRGRTAMDTVNPVSNLISPNFDGTSGAGQI